MLWASASWRSFLSLLSKLALARRKKKRLEKQTINRSGKRNMLLQAKPAIVSKIAEKNHMNLGKPFAADVNVLATPKILLQAFWSWVTMWGDSVISMGFRCSRSLPLTIHPLTTHLLIVYGLKRANQTLPTLKIVWNGTVMVIVELCVATES